MIVFERHSFCPQIEYLFPQVLHLMRALDKQVTTLEFLSILLTKIDGINLVALWLKKHKYDTFCSISF